MSTRQMQRQSYLPSRWIGDYRAAKRGRLAERLSRRYYHRSVIRAMRKARLW